ncbi:VWA domain-containing protein [Mesorhizobium sp. DCY119]|nr:VWA domain-containing protein [Mesorhizobium sp. DCY119]
MARRAEALARPAGKGSGRLWRHRARGRDMSATANSLPAALGTELLAGFPAALREAGLPIDPGRAMNYLHAVRVSRLSGIGDLARAGRVTLTASPEEFPLYDSVFEVWFGAAPIAGVVKSPDEQESPRSDRPQGSDQRLDLLDGDAAGQAAADDHVRNRKNFARAGEDDRDTLARMRRRLDRLPATRSRSWRPAPAGHRIDLAGTIRAARKTFGETLRILRQARPERPRRLLLLIDVSGSMKAQSEPYLRFAHLLTRQRPKVETFCFGTRLSRVTKVLKHRNEEQALAGLADIVFDFDGGTLIGRSLEDFLSVSRHTALVRGAVVIVFSDGLERGDPGAMVHAVERLSRLGHRLVWVTPLAADPRYRPVTRAMAGILPSLDLVADGGSLAALERLIGDLAGLDRRPRRQAGRQYSGASFEAPLRQAQGRTSG